MIALSLRSAGNYRVLVSEFPESKWWHVMGVEHIATSLTLLINLTKCALYGAFRKLSIDNAVAVDRYKNEKLLPSQQKKDRKKKQKNCANNVGVDSYPLMNGIPATSTWLAPYAYVQ